MASDLSRFLIQAALDEAFRELALDDPEAAFEGYALTDDDKNLLRRRDPAVLALLGRAIREALPTAEPTVEPTAGPAPAPTRAEASPGSQATALPEIALIVRLRPWALPLGDGKVQISWSASMEPYAPPEDVGITAPARAAPEGLATSAREAAEAVLTAPADARYARLLDLVQLLDEPEG